MSGQKGDFVRDTDQQSPTCTADNDGAPVTCVSWDDAQAYIQWIILKTGKIYHLPSAAEWQEASTALNLADQALSKQWLDGCGDGIVQQDSDASCQLRWVDAGTDTPTTREPAYSHNDLGFRLVRKLSRVSIY